MEPGEAAQLYVFILGVLKRVFWVWVCGIPTRREQSTVCDCEAQTAALRLRLKQVPAVIGRSMRWIFEATSGHAAIAHRACYSWAFAGCIFWLCLCGWVLSRFVHTFVAV